MPWYWLFGFIVLVAAIIGGTSVSNLFFLLIIVAVAMLVQGYRVAE